ncbi:hypothetical protein VIAG107301_09295 [Vibrio agarivorans]
MNIPNIHKMRRSMSVALLIIGYVLVLLFLSNYLFSR